MIEYWLRDSAIWQMRNLKLREADWHAHFLIASEIVTGLEPSLLPGFRAYLLNYYWSFPDSLPFPIGKEDGTGDRGDGNFPSDNHGPSFPLKGITEQQKEGIRMVKRVMMSLEGEDGLDEVYSFRWEVKTLVTIFSCTYINFSLDQRAS